VYPSKAKEPMRSQKQAEAVFNHVYKEYIPLKEQRFHKNMKLDQIFGDVVVNPNPPRNLFADNAKHVINGSD
jgi:hypothetical protein